MLVINTVRTKNDLTWTHVACRYFAGIAAFTAAGGAHAAIITDDDEVIDFGWVLSLSGGNLAVGAPGGGQSGSAYFYTDDRVLTLQKQNAGSETYVNYFGYAISSFGGSALVGDFADRGSESITQAGAAYYYRNLDSVSGGGVVTETLKLQASDSVANAYFGRGLSLFGDDALVGAFGDRHPEINSNIGAAYYFRGLNTAVADSNGVVTETLKLSASNLAGQNALFGYLVSLSGDNALVAAPDANAAKGAVYYYRDLPNAVVAPGETLQETFVLEASDGRDRDEFGISVSMDGNSAVIGSENGGNGNGAVYYYRGLDGEAADFTVYETAKLLASNGANRDEFGFSSSLSGDNALVGARSHNAYAGAAYLFKDLEQVADSSTVTENVILTASDGRGGDLFGTSVSVNGTSFAIGASHAKKVYTGDIRTFTVLNDGNTELATEGLSFISHDDWVIGATTSGNRVTLSNDIVAEVADVADVTGAGKHVYIGQQSGANSNELQIDGTLLANNVFVGAAGNSDNVIAFGLSSEALVDAIYLALGNSIALAGEFQDYQDLVDWLQQQGGVDLYANQQGITIENADQFLAISAIDGYTLYTAVPEPSAYAAAFSVIVLGAVFVRRLSRSGAGRNALV